MQQLTRKNEPGSIDLSSGGHEGAAIAYKYWQDTVFCNFPLPGNLGILYQTF